MTLRSLDLQLLHFSRKISIPMARFGFFVIFFWFGFLKVLDLSPASALVQSLFERTIPFMGFPTFMFLFGLLECLIGVLFLIPKLERLAFGLLLAHMATTFMPLFLLPEITWSALLVPTLEGQYIIKNLALIASALGVIAHLHPIHAHRIFKK
ncbi:MAG: hypothetical protein QG585_350 [Patescibacteria group bacterium]|jgi:uncharacterized membrane protein YkgB|nr:hypothetical protein [Patescibacteria group bacterium]